MQKETAELRLFFAFEVTAPWPHLPKGRLLNELERHMTVVFLGATDFNTLQPKLSDVPSLPFKVGKVGKFDKGLFLPKRHPHVVAWHVSWLNDPNLDAYQKSLSTYLELVQEERPFLPHVTLCRHPFNIREWEKAFSPIPMMITHLHLYESKGDLKYEPLWSRPVRLPFEELEHTADIAYLVRGESLKELQDNAFAALAFHTPSFFNFMGSLELPNNIEEVIMRLNRAIAHMDSQEGSPFKAVSFHGSIEEEPDKTLKWEMIVDV